MQACMQRLFLLLTFLTAFASAKAQYIVSGGGVTFGTEVENIGINLHSLYKTEMEIRVGLGFNYYFPHREVIKEDELSAETNVWAINLNGHYLFTDLHEDINVYPLAGLNVARVRVTTERTVERKTEPDYTLFKNETGYEFGGNIGVGGSYNLEKDIKPYLEIKYVISRYDQFVFTLGSHFFLK